MKNAITRAIVESFVLMAFIAKILLAPYAARADELDLGDDDASVSTEAPSLPSGDFDINSMVNNPPTLNTEVADTENKSVPSEFIQAYNTGGAPAYGVSGGTGVPSTATYGARSAGGSGTVSPGGATAAP